MSRCFPHQARGLARNRVCDEALTEPIKKERVKPKTEQRYEKKSEGKLRREKQEKLDNIYGKLKGLDEQLEKSDLTEDHSSQNLCYLSDGTEDSSKRKRETLSSNGGYQINGNGLKIRIAFKRHREPDPSSSKEPVCSTSGRAESLAQQRVAATTKSNVIITKISPPTNKKRHPEDLQKKQISSPHGARTADELHNTEIKKAALQYKSLIEDWVPVSHDQVEIEDDDQDWLFGKKQPKISEAKRFKVDNGEEFLCNSSTSLLPQAQYLPEADIWALPYTVPF